MDEEDALKNHDLVASDCGGKIPVALDDSEQDTSWPSLYSQEKGKEMELAIAKEAALKNHDLVASDCGGKIPVALDDSGQETSGPSLYSQEKCTEMDSAIAKDYSLKYHDPVASDCGGKIPVALDDSGQETSGPSLYSQEKCTEMDSAISEEDALKNHDLVASDCGGKILIALDDSEQDTSWPSLYSQEKGEEMELAIAKGEDNSHNSDPTSSKSDEVSHAHYHEVLYFPSDEELDEDNSNNPDPTSSDNHYRSRSLSFCEQEMESFSSDDNFPYASQPHSSSFVAMSARNRCPSPMTYQLVIGPPGGQPDNYAVLVEEMGKFFNSASSKDNARKTNRSPYVPVASTSSRRIVYEGVPNASSSNRPRDSAAVSERQMLGVDGSRTDNRNSQERSNEPPLPQSITPVPDLTLDTLYLIYRNLGRKDLYNMQFVCKLWFEAVHDTRLWFGYVFEVKHGMSLTSILFHIRHLPVVQSIKCSYILPQGDADAIVEEMVNHMKELREIHFYGGLSAENAEKIVDAYVDLKSVTLNVCNDDFVESLAFFSSCEKLTELIINGIVPRTHILQRIADAMDLVATGFPNLQHLDSRGTLSTLMRFKNDIYKTVLKAKSSQLLSLKFTIDDRIDPEVLEEIEKCTKLEHLFLEVFPSFSCTFHNLTNLKSLSLEFYRTDTHTLDAVFENSLELSKMTFLRSLKVSVRQPAVMERFLKKLVEQVPQLEEFELTNVSVDSLSDDLIYIHELPNLRLLSLRKCFTANDEDIRNISLCRKLECLRIGCSDLTTAAVDYLSNCTTLTSLLLTECYFGEEIIAYLMQKLYFLKLLSLSFVHNDFVDIENICHIRDEVHPTLKLHII